MATHVEGSAARVLYPRARRADAQEEVAQFFAPQHASTIDLPDPVPLLRNLTLGVLETFTGERRVDQLARWVTEDVFRSVSTHANLQARARSARGLPAVRRVHDIVSIHVTHPADGIVEAVVITTGPARVRAIALRLEGIDRRWRCTSFTQL
ncbi:Rv3235 family protein [Microbacterium sp.]|uniref:Rv3235 family protein n=1 Tax=Microbacterium sp. TaxID=51671 RepID=UPI0037C59715